MVTVSPKLVFVSRSITSMAMMRLRSSSCITLEITVMFVMARIASSANRMDGPRTLPVPTGLEYHARSAKAGRLHASRMRARASRMLRGRCMAMVNLASTSALDWAAAATVASSKRAGSWGMVVSWFMVFFR